MYIYTQIISWHHTTMTSRLDFPIVTDIVKPSQPLWELGENSQIRLCIEQVHLHYWVMKRESDNDTIAVEHCRHRFSKRTTG